LLLLMQSALLKTIHF